MARSGLRPPSPLEAGPGDDRLRIPLALGLALLALGAAAAPAGGGSSDTVFTDYTPLSSNAELARRLLSPLTAARLARTLASSGRALRDQPVDLAQERFLVHVPAQAPPEGYAVLAFVSPWPQATLPQGWASVLDRHGTIFVSPERAGNDATDLGRREPLALIAAENVRRLYKVDADRIYVGGLSGGSRVAMRLALGYPDLFAGAILNAGSDPIGDARTPLPAKDLFYRFQASTRLVYLTGEEDAAALSADAASMQAMRRWCVFGLEDHTIPFAGHAIASPEALSRALDSLASKTAPDPGKLADCRSAIEKDLAGRLNGVEALLAGGKVAEARRRLTAIDARFGGLAAPRSVELEQRLDAQPR